MPDSRAGQGERSGAAKSLPPGDEPWRNGCVGPFYGNESDAYPCDVLDCPVCRPRRARAAEFARAEARRAAAQAERLLIDCERGLVQFKK